jgi:YidC/Oxa1 family membrane protein insertase
MPFIFVFFVIRFPVGLMLYWIATNLWTVGQQATLRKLMGPPPNAPPPKAARPRIPKPSGGKGLQGAGRSRRR